MRGQEAGAHDHNNKLSEHLEAYIRTDQMLKNITQKMAYTIASLSTAYCL